MVQAGEDGGRKESSTIVSCELDENFVHVADREVVIAGTLRLVHAQERKKPVRMEPTRPPAVSIPASETEVLSLRDFLYIVSKEHSINPHESARPTLSSTSSDFSSTRTMPGFSMPNHFHWLSASDPRVDSHGGATPIE